MQAEVLGDPMVSSRRLNHGLLSWLAFPAQPPTSYEVQDNILPQPPGLGAKGEVTESSSEVLGGPLAG